MVASKRQQMLKLLTVAYLISTFFVTAATSKAGEGGVKLANLGPEGITNYKIQSDCLGRPDVIAIRVESGAITETIASDGTSNSLPTLDFTQFSFPSRQILVGMDQVGVNRKCIVRNKQSDSYQGDQKKSENYWFLKSGYLTTVQYECSGGNAGTCSVSLSELPAGDLKTSLQN